MLVLIANLGSTSFKYRLFDMADGDGRVLAQGGYERVTDHGEVIEDALKELESSGAVSSRSEIDAVGFKTVLGRNLSGCVEADDRVLEALEGFADVAPAHNPPYAAGIRQFSRILPDAKLVALFETAFYQWVPEEGARYAVPEAWHEAGIRRYGFHGASHKFIAERSAELLGREDVAACARGLYQDGPQPIDKPLRVISCHLGGSSSVTGIRNGVAVGTSMGFSPQSGLPQNNRVGDLDSGAIPYAAKVLGLEMPEIERQLTKEAGLLGVSGVSNDLRDIHDAATAGNARAQLSIDMLIHEVRRWASSFLFQLGGIDGFVFTAGIGENGPLLREKVCAGLEEFGIKIDPERNAACAAKECEISTADSRVKVFVIPANEELVLANEVFRKISSNNSTQTQ
ncbi:acetate/propionate family kinase [Haloferula rosea]|uniref:Acetate kinase n=1 Tax=Haloferula rosea TaxID=490093 RepID=A0A934R8C7_9BACT|nr:acetate/propionate family kinase [Haloferula rosea]MBK1825833.1 acetate/propionate family kinase [Haloferula rosea]